MGIAYGTAECPLSQQSAKKLLWIVCLLFDSFVEMLAADKISQIPVKIQDRLKHKVKGSVQYKTWFVHQIGSRICLLCRGQGKCLVNP